jgi:hypothetical protein
MLHVGIGQTRSNSDTSLSRADRPFGQLFYLAQTNHGFGFASVQVHLNHVVGAPSEQFCRGVLLKDVNEFINASGNEDWHGFSLHFVNNWKEDLTVRESQISGVQAHFDE